MKAFGGVCILVLILDLSIASAMPTRVVRDPEQVIDFSIFEIVPKKTQAPVQRKKAKPVVAVLKDSSDPAYGDQVAKLIEASRVHLRACVAKYSIPSDRVDVQTLETKLRIDRKGRALVSVISSDQMKHPVAPCVLSVLSTIPFPSHARTEEVVFHLPVALRMEVL